MFGFASEKKMKAYVDEQYKNKVAMMKIEIDSKIAALNEEVNVIIRQYTSSQEKLNAENAQRQKEHIERMDKFMDLVKGYLETLNKAFK